MEKLQQFCEDVIAFYKENPHIKVCRDLFFMHGENDKLIACCPMAVPLAKKDETGLSNSYSGAVNEAYGFSETQMWAFVTAFGSGKADSRDAIAEPKFAEAALQLRGELCSQLITL